MKAAALSPKHGSELQLAVERAMAQWLPDAPEAPAEVVQGLDRVLLFLRQNGSPSKQARQVASLAFCWGQQVVRTGGFRWASVSDDATVNPSLVSSDEQRACLVIDCVTVLVLEPEAPSLSAVFRQLVAGELPEIPGCVRLEPSAEA
ncbi:MAG: hypothetical protein JNG84_11805 [Archangium sp.]|nr:hypothetical protein [Archangium sp.]